MSSSCGLALREVRVGGAAPKGDTVANPATGPLAVCKRTGSSPVPSRMTTVPVVPLRFCAHNLASNWASVVRVTTTVGCDEGTLGKASMPTTLADQSPSHSLGFAPPLGVTPALPAAAAATSAQVPSLAAGEGGAWLFSGGLRAAAA